MISNPEYREDDSTYGYKIVADSFREQLRLDDNLKNQINFCNPLNISYIANYYPAQRRAVLTMFESANIHNDWVRAINSHADLLLVPNKYNLNNFRRAGVTKPIEIVPLPTQASYFQFRERFLDSKVRILHYNAGEPRKGYNELIECWIKYFKDRDDVELLLKNNARSDPHAINYPFFANGYHPAEIPNVTKLLVPYDTTKMVELLHSCHLFVYPSRGEGWGYTPREAMATGIPCILTDTHSFAEIPHETFLSVKSSLEYTNDPMPFWFFETYKPDVDHLAKQIQWAIDNYQEMKVKAAKAYEYVDKQCRNNDTLINILRKYDFEV